MTYFCRANAMCNMTHCNAAHINTLDIVSQCTHCREYQHSDTPRYPVPAIPLHVEYHRSIWGNYIALSRLLDRGLMWRHLRLIQTWFDLS